MPAIPHGHGKKRPTAPPAKAAPKKHARAWLQAKAEELRRWAERHQRKGGGPV